MTIWLLVSLFYNYNRKIAKFCSLTTFVMLNIDDCCWSVFSKLIHTRGADKLYGNVYIFDFIKGQRSACGWCFLKEPIKGNVNVTKQSSFIQDLLPKTSILLTSACVYFPFFSVSLVMFALIGVLVFSEIYSYTSYEVVYEYSVDQDTSS